MTLMAAEVRCEITDFPDWLCDCPEHAKVRPSTEVITLAQAERLVGRDLPQYAYRPRPSVAAQQKTREWSAGDREPKRIDCDHPTGDNRKLCPGCTTELVEQLSDVPQLVHQLSIAQSRQVSFVDHGSPKRVIMHPWADVLDERLPGTQIPKRYSVASYSRPAASAKRRLTKALAAGSKKTDPILLSMMWLDALDDMLLDPQIPRLARRLSEAVLHARKVIERPADLEVAGDCPKCGELVFAELLERNANAQQREAQYTECSHCHTPVKVAEAKRRALDAHPDRLMPMNDLIGAIEGANEEPITRNQVNKWVSSGRLLRRSIDEITYRDAEDGEQEASEQPGMVRIVTKTTVYRLSDVRELAQEMRERRRR